MPLTCPTCGSRNLRPARYKDNEERLNALLFVAPLRCKDCKTRFVSRTVFLEDFRYARCPECDRMDLNGWTGKTHHPTGWTKFKVALGAYKWRCEYCRLNFASFRRRKEPFTFSRWKKRNPHLMAEKPATVAAAATPAGELPAGIEGEKEAPGAIETGS